jgi:hypothetical protein
MRNWVDAAVGCAIGLSAFMVGLAAVWEETGIVLALSAVVHLSLITALIAGAQRSGWILLAAGLTIIALFLLFVSYASSHIAD